MVRSTLGIILKVIKHSDSSAVVHVFTEKHGRRAYFIRGLSKKKNSPRALLFPLSIVEIQATERESKSLQYIKEIHLATPLPSLISNPAKGSIALFLTEILEKSIVENYQNDVLFSFVKSAIEILDHSSNVGNFHIWFLLNMSKYLGFYPTTLNNKSTNSEIFFRLDNGSFQFSKPILEPSANSEDSEVILAFLGMNFDEASVQKLSSTRRASVLRTIVDYYKIHVAHLNYVASLDVLETVFEA